VTSADRDNVATEKLVTDALRALTGVTVQQTTPGQGAPIIRGLKGSAILHLVDGMRLNNAIFRAAPTPWFALIPASSVERLEVVRGAPAALYGSEAVGGVVQSVSRLPVFTTESPGYAGEGLVAFDSAASLRSLRASFDAGTHEFAASFSAEYLETGDRRTGDGGRVTPSGYTAKAVRAVLSATPSGAGSWFVDFHYLEQPETPRSDELVPGFGQVEPSSAEFFFAPNRRAFVHFRRQSRWRDLDFKLDAAWQRIDDDRRTRNLGSTQRRFETNRSDLYGLTFSASGSGDSWSWIAGADLYYDEVRSARHAVDLVSGASAALASRFPDGSTVGQAGLFVSGSRTLGAHHRLNVGVRYTDLRIDLPDGTSIRPGRASGDLGWIAEWRDGLQFVATIGSGFRAPNIADLGTLGERPGNRFNIPNPGLGSERATHGDLGLRFYGENYSGEVRLFALRYSDRIVSVSTGASTPDGRDVVQSVNAASALLRGVEGAARFRVSDVLSLATRISWTYGEQDVAGTSEPGDRIPPLQARIDLEWLINESWTLDTWLVAADRQDRLSARDTDDVRIDPLGTPGWVAAGTRLGWTDGGAWRVDFGIDNLFDKRYRVHGSGIDAPGRNLSLTLRRSW
ncbi:MAG: TonB-dependent receptor, partial [Gammaproteobacteria bacterium]|nr:TonB-dependent receptor [Gammaproteobacteria bacterium]